METEDGRVVAVWEYDDSGAYERIDAAVAADPASRVAQQYRATLGPVGWVWDANREDQMRDRDREHPVTEGPDTSQARVFGRRGTCVVSTVTPEI